ncbi:hypothetical protein CWI42_040940 [Ordospora colligata]|uniref:peptidyl-tRNA hydrolase n=1 Tax=Ordospora colligata OC4 TaxID=1354746 RepID=A0A0B2UKX1_9MICR|nr:uncharacterized protein M896_040950 [Ordospora colligata OC4]KHN69899.1 hypothetical protein M896_040950 [Ordospora colligata OC4]TBU16069.1 hypothetical protein CWI41_040940 [Ordospora colligata]TBU16282.1 hypothetical protein CWI40_040940 [Ordospora colligata]TBU18986.1 hypothetical protein CWI42_040940 [Ordospora colligata]
MDIAQYILLRGDLKGFSTGALIAQACHSSVCSIETYRRCADTVMYVADIGSMKKIILRIEQSDIDGILEHFLTHNIDHTVWIEHPENITTCISTRPYNRHEIKQTVEYLKRFRLFK